MERMPKVKPRSVCTWKDCDDDAVHEYKSKTGEVWAVLCEHHNVEMDVAITGMNPRFLVRAWILAQGGAKRASERV